MRYETDGEVEEEVKNWELVHKECGQIKGYAYDEGTGARNGALWAVEEGIVRSGNGFWEARNEGVRAVAQCERALFGCDCAECVGRAAEVAQEDCGGALSADVYLNGCYLSYTTYTYPSGNFPSFKHMEKTLSSLFLLRRVNIPTSKHSFFDPVNFLNRIS